jgi:hypothetical protein
VSWLGRFQPEELLLLSTSFDEAWQQLERMGVRFDQDYQRQQARNMLAK